MKKYLLFFLTLGMSAALTFAQTEVLIDDFTGTINTDLVYGDDYNTGSGPNQSIVSYENDMLKAEYTFDKPSWFPRAVWYHFEEKKDFSATPVMEISFMIEDNDNETLKVRFDLYGDGAEPYNDTIREQMETNGNPWEYVADNGEWYTLQSNFTAENRWFCTYWNGGIDPIRVDSTNIGGFEAFVQYGDDNLANMPGTLWIDYIKMKDQITGVEEIIYGRENAFGLALYPSPAVNTLNFNSANMLSNIELVDLTGRVVRKAKDIRAFKLQMDVSGLNTGVYIAHARDMQGRSVIKKFIKQ